MKTFTGPMSKQIIFGSKYMTLIPDRGEKIEIFKNCDNKDGQYQCVRTDRVIGNENQCLMDLYDGKGKTEACQGM